MKKIFLLSAILFSLLSMNAQTGTKTQTSPTKKPVTAVQKTTTPGIQLKTLEDSANYAMGLSIANFYKQQGVSKINSSIVTKAINDVMNGKQIMLNDMQANSCMMTYLNKQQMTKSKPNIDAGEAFLATNKKKPGVTTTASGLQYEVMTQGTGAKPGLKDTVVCNYKGTFLNGSVFDDSYSRGVPAEFAVTGVIRGWTEVLQLMPEGSKYKVYVPYELGYGGADYNGIPGGSMLTFEIELMKVKTK